MTAKNPSLSCSTVPTEKRSRDSIAVAESAVSVDTGGDGVVIL